jgi:ABC-type transport system substrate-binding protein
LAGIPALSRIAAGNRNERKRLVDRVQEILMENLPLIPLLSPDIW